MEKGRKFHELRSSSETRQSTRKRKKKTFDEDFVVEDNLSGEGSSESEVAEVEASGKHLEGSQENKDPVNAALDLMVDTAEARLENRPSVGDPISSLLALGNGDSSHLLPDQTPAAPAPKRRGRPPGKRSKKKAEELAAAAAAAAAAVGITQQEAPSDALVFVGQLEEEEQLGDKKGEELDDGRFAEVVAAAAAAAEMPPVPTLLHLDTNVLKKDLFSTLSHSLSNFFTHYSEARSVSLRPIAFCPAENGSIFLIFDGMVTWLPELVAHLSADFQFPITRDHTFAEPTTEGDQPKDGKGETVKNGGGGGGGASVWWDGSEELSLALDVLAPFDFQSLNVSVEQRQLQRQQKPRSQKGPSGVCDQSNVPNPHELVQIKVEIARKDLNFSTSTLQPSEFDALVDFCYEATRELRAGFFAEPLSRVFVASTQQYIFDKMMSAATTGSLEESGSVKMDASTEGGNVVDQKAEFEIAGDPQALRPAESTKAKILSNLASCFFDIPEAFARHTFDNPFLPNPLCFPSSCKPETSDVNLVLTSPQAPPASASGSGSGSGGSGEEKDASENNRMGKEKSESVTPNGDMTEDLTLSASIPTLVTPAPLFPSQPEKSLPMDTSDGGEPSSGKAATNAPLFSFVIGHSLEQPKVGAPTNDCRTCIAGFRALFKQRLGERLHSFYRWVPDDDLHIPLLILSTRLHRVPGVAMPSLQNPILPPEAYSSDVLLSDPIISHFLTSKPPLKEGKLGSHPGFKHPKKGRGGKVGRPPKSASQQAQPYIEPPSRKSDTSTADFLEVQSRFWSKNTPTTPVPAEGHPAVSPTAPMSTGQLSEQKVFPPLVHPTAQDQGPPTTPAPPTSTGSIPVTSFLITPPTTSGQLPHQPPLRPIAPQTPQQTSPAAPSPAQTPILSTPITNGPSPLSVGIPVPPPQGPPVALRFPPGHILVHTPNGPVIAPALSLRGLAATPGGLVFPQMMTSPASSGAKMASPGFPAQFLQLAQANALAKLMARPPQQQPLHIVPAPQKVLTSAEPDVIALGCPVRKHPSPPSASKSLSPPQ